QELNSATSVLDINPRTFFWLTIGVVGPIFLWSVASLARNIYRRCLAYKEDSLRRERIRTSLKQLETRYLALRRIFDDIDHQEEPPDLGKAPLIVEATEPWE